MDLSLPWHDMTDPRSPCKAKENEMRNAVLIEKQRREQYQRMVPGQNDLRKKGPLNDFFKLQKIEPNCSTWLTMIFLPLFLGNMGFMWASIWASYGLQYN